MNWALLAALALLLSAASVRAEESPAEAEEAPPTPPPPASWSGDVGGDLKAFVVGTLPYDHLLMAENANAQVYLDGRLKMSAKVGEVWSFEMHQVITALTAPTATQLEEELGALGMSLEGSSQSMGFGTGVGTQAPEALQLSWSTKSEAGHELRGRVDQMHVRARLGKVDLTLGRQPISFGTGRFFTPMDLVNPFFPATVDTEYKPGVDALRLEAYAGLSSKLAVVAAYAGSWDRKGMVFAAHGQTTVGVTDLSLMLAEVHGEHVLGAGAEGGVGPVGLHGEVTLTLPQDDDVFIRASGGADFRPGATTTVSGELYYQSFGAWQAQEYLTVATSERFARGEVWQMGRLYAGFVLAQEVTPLVQGSVGLIGNLADPSGMVMINMAVSLAENSELVLGSYLGVGARPENLTLSQVISNALASDDPEDWSAHLGVRSEFGLVPTVLFLQAKSYF